MLLSFYVFVPIAHPLLSLDKWFFEIYLIPYEVENAFILTSACDCEMILVWSMYSTINKYRVHHAH